MEEIEEEAATSSSSLRRGNSFIPEYDVFLSFRGKDVRKTFAGHVLHRLADHARVRTFFDETELPVGEKIQNILKKAEQSNMFVIIFSENYADSRFCLMEASTFFKCGRMIIPIFYHVKVSDVKKQEGVFGEGFQRLIESEAISNELIDEWKAALKHAAGFKGFEVDKTTCEADVVKELAKSIQDKVVHVNDWLLMPEYQVGSLDDHVANVCQRLSLEDNSNVLMVVISGEIGFGKTTLAGATYNKIWRLFDSCSFLSNIARETSTSDDPKDNQQANYNFLLLQNQLIHDILKRESSQPVGDVKVRAAHINRLIRRNKNKVLIVLDDVNSAQQLQCLGLNNVWTDLGPGSRVIVTTGVQDQEKWPPSLKRGSKYEILELTKEDSLKLFCFHVFGMEKPLINEYEEYCKEVISKIDSSPLVIKLTAHHFMDLRDHCQWQLNLKSVSCLSRELSKLLKTHYYGLSPDAQRVFIDTACFLLGTDLNVAISILQGWRSDEPLAVIREMKRASLLRNNRRNSLEMQISVRNMGMKLAKEESHDPMRRRRLWDHNDVSTVLQQLTGRRADTAKEIECMLLESDRVDQNASLNRTVLEKLPNLRVLRINPQWPVKEKINNLPNQLKWLKWQACDRRNFSCCFENLKDIAVLDLSYSQLDHKWFGRAQVLKGLKVLVLSHCKRLRVIPDLSEFKNLEKLVLDGCEMMTEVHPSVGNLERLKVLTMKWCHRLKYLPDDVWTSRFLEVLDISCCKQLVISVQLLRITPSLKKQVILCQNKADVLEYSLSILHVPGDGSCPKKEIVVDVLEPQRPWYYMKMKVPNLLLCCVRNQAVSFGIDGTSCL